MISFSVKSSKNSELIDITDGLRRQTKKNGFSEGVLFIFVPHTTCAIICNENEQNLKEDFIELFSLLKGRKWRHNSVDSNAEAHLLNSIFKNSAFVFVSKGELQLGTWQSIMLAELDGPRERKILMDFIPR